LFLKKVKTSGELSFNIFVRGEVISYFLALYVIMGLGEC